MTDAPLRERPGPPLGAQVEIDAPRRAEALEEAPAGRGPAPARRTGEHQVDVAGVVELAPALLAQRDRGETRRVGRARPLPN